MGTTIQTPPTSTLPPISKLSSTPTNELKSGLVYLSSLYNPEVRGSRRKPMSAEDEGIRKNADILEELRADAFERGYAIKWLTTLVSHSEHFLTSENDSSEGEQLINDAAALLAICAGASASGVVTRRYCFNSRGADINIQIADAPLESQDFSSVGAQTWGSACILVEMIAEDPDRFSLPLSSPPSQEPFRVLELGAGTGLVGLTVAAMLKNTGRNVDVVLTDYYPSVIANLRKNLQLNPSVQGPDTSVEVLPLDWSTFPLEDRRESLFKMPFDFIVGADIIYEEKHAYWIKCCLETLLRSDPDHPGRFHLLIPLRPTHSEESHTISRVFPSACDIDSQRKVGSLRQLVVFSETRFSCDAYSSGGMQKQREEEVQYAHWVIGWQ